METSPVEGKPSSPEPGHILTQLSAALDNPDFRALEWSKNGKSVVMHTKLYNEEMEKNKELFPELVNLGCVTALQTWLRAYGFKLMGVNINTKKLLWQHSDFQRAPDTTKKRKKRMTTKQPKKCKLRDKEGHLLRVRPVYDYINLEMPELMNPSAEEDEVPGLAQPEQTPAALGAASVPPQEGTSISSALEIPAPGTDNSMPADVERLLRYITNLKPPFIPWDE